MVAVTDYRALVSGCSWYEADTSGKPLILTYSFEAAPPSYFTTAYPAAASTFSPLNEGEKAVVRQALQAWSDVSGVTFIETARHQGDITFAFYNLDLTGGGSNTAGQGAYPAAFAYESSGRTGVYAGDGLSGGDV